MLLYKGNSMLLVKHGLYRVDADQGLFKVYDGEAIVKGESGQLTLHKGKQTVLTGALMAENFDPKADDELYRWSDRRSGYLAKANVSSANSIVSGGSGFGRSRLWRLWVRRSGLCRFGIWQVWAMAVSAILSRRIFRLWRLQPVAIQPDVRHVYVCSL